MSRATLEKEIFLDEANGNGLSTGYLMLNSSETITLDNIKGAISSEARGKMSGHKEETLLFDIQENVKITAGEPSKTPFTFDLSNLELASYIGKNVSISTVLEIQIDVNDDDIDKLKKGLFSRLKSLVTSDYTIKVAKPLDLQIPSTKYQVIETSSDLLIQPNIIISIIIAFAFGISYAVTIPEFNIGYVMLGIASTLLLIYLASTLFGKILGAISMKIFNDNDAFTCKVQTSNKFNLSNISMHYEIIEKVIDRRGTSSSTYTETIYTSKKQKIANYRSNPSLTFPFPKRMGIHSLEYGNASIYWKMYLKGTYLGLEFKYIGKFQVERSNTLDSSTHVA
ncbi:MAG: hypothetical protein AB8F78_02010 [Saprospiraceae bacterium]